MKSIFIRNFYMKKIAFAFVIIAIFWSCRKETNDPFSYSSIRIIPTESEPKQVRLIASAQENILVYVSSGNIQSPAAPQEVFMLNRHAEKIKTIYLSDTVYQYLNAVPGLDGGFLICGSSDGYGYFALFHIDDEGNVSKLRDFVYAGGTNKNEPFLAVFGHEYIVMYYAVGYGFYCWKGDMQCNDVFNKKIPVPNAFHSSLGLNFGEKTERLLCVNDTLIIIQGITYDQYASELIENCFLRSIDENITKKWYSSNFDSTKNESAAGLFITVDDKVVLFGTKTSSTVFQGYGEVFLRQYTLEGVFKNEIVYPKVGGTPNRIFKAIQSPDGGFLLTGANNQLSANDLVSPNKIILIKLNGDLSVAWTKTISTSFPSKGFDICYQNDGTISLIGLMKDNYSTNKLIYMHLYSTGDVINN